MTEPEYLLVEQTPFDVERISQILREADLICTPVGIGEEGFDPYNLADYRVQERLHGDQGLFLLDLNVFREVNSLHPEQTADAGSHGKIAAAFMAFCIYAGIQLEPSLALQEWFSPGETSKKARQLQLFRELDRTDPALFADLALGNATSLPRRSVPSMPKVSFPGAAEWPGGWHFDYTALLKVAVLTLEGGKQRPSPAFAMERFLNWCWTDYLFSSPAIHFGGLYLSPLREKRMFKSLWSGDRQKAIAGVQNATWDLTYLRGWASRALKQQNSDSLNFFCSLDKGLRESGRELLALGGEATLEEQVAPWKRLWGDRDGQRLFEVYFDLASRQEDPARSWPPGKAAREKRAEELKQELEDDLIRLGGGTC